MTAVRRLAVLAALLLWAAPAAAQQPPPAAWDQAKVTAIAKQLADSVGGLYDAVKKVPPPPMGAQRRSFYNATQDLRRLGTETRALAAQLESGDGKDATLPSYKQIQMIRRDAAEEGRTAGVIPDDVLAKVDKARDLLLQLSGYYQE